MKKPLRLGEMFCGPGGLSLGVKLAVVESFSERYDLQILWAIDNHPDTCETFRRNLMPDKPESVICGDVRKMSLGELERVNGFAFGFPCNDFSIVGEKRGVEGEYGPLYTYGVAILSESKPDWFIAENVGGLHSANGGHTFRKILADLRTAGDGYELTAHLYRFEQYGVPQTRHRILIVGIRSSLGLTFRVPRPTHLKRFVSAGEAIGTPPIPATAPNNEPTRQSSTVVERLDHIRPGENAWNADLPKRLRLNVKTTTLSHIYRRLERNRPSYTITGSGGGGTHVYHWKENRALTNRERARLQTFPDDFVFSGSKESVRRQIGMAVPPQGAKVIVQALLKTLSGIEYDYVNPKWDASGQLVLPFSATP